MHNSNTGGIRTGMFLTGFWWVWLAVQLWYSGTPSGHSCPLYLVWIYWCLLVYWPSSKNTDLLWLACRQVFHWLWDCPWWYRDQAALPDILLPRRMRSLRYWDNIDLRLHLARLTRLNQLMADPAFFSSQLSPSYWMNPAWWNWPTKISPNKLPTLCQFLQSLTMTDWV